ncbi:hypothetical protein ACFE33_01350 [Falsihalocynthiibacter sp. SS001]|uniref:hypothetical protein n=1 Tax=Falsihalocynthiibacter sp. SS001 TaxID=3349698 RepID=UPI0036D36058
MSGFSTDDVRAAVAAGVINESQASRLVTMAQSRQGVRTYLSGEDEPFEFFRGFAEIFVTVGLGLLFAGIFAITALLGGGAVVPIVGMLLCAGFAVYFTKKRRMSLPSIALATGFGLFMAISTGMIIGTGEIPEAGHGLIIGLVGMAGMALYFNYFKLPFSMFILGLFGIVTILSLAGIVSNDRRIFFDFPESLFDLGHGSVMAYGSLIFGVLAFAGGIWFDLKDPHRISRYSSSAFWLHMLAAPALVNVVALSLFNIGGIVGYTLTSAALLCVTIVALVIDRRSFLTAGIGYIAVLIFMALENSTDEHISTVVTLLVLGGVVTFLGTWWVQIRDIVMQALPNFPLKKRLPPYSESV